MTRGTCDACDKGRIALHRGESSGIEGSFCCVCARCTNPEACIAEWLGECEDARDAAAEARANR